MQRSSMRGLLLTHWLSVTAEWAVTVGLLVHAFAWGGSRSVGVVSIALLVPPLVSAPLVGAALARWRTHAIRCVVLGAQVVFFGVAGAAAAAGAPTPVLVPFVVLGLSALTAIAPTTAALLPQIARSTDGLVRGNLRVTYCDSSSGLLGSLAAGVIIGLAGPEAVFAAGAAGAAVGLGATMWRVGPLVRAARSVGGARRNRVIRRALLEFRSHPWGRGVLCLASARNMVLGAFDILLVILALEVLDMGDGGPGYLGALVGIGALLSTAVTTVVVRLAKLRVALVAAVVVAGVLSIGLGLQIDRPMVFLALPIIGLTIAGIDALVRALLVRSADPRNLGPLFTSLGLVAGVSQIAGSVLAQVMLAVGDIEITFVVIGGVLLALAGLSIPSLRRSDENADIPVVEMALLSRLPMLSALPTSGLEQVARAVETIDIEQGDSLMAEGQQLDGCYVIADGEFELTNKGTYIKTAERGDVIGEVSLLTGISPNRSAVAVSSGSVLRIERRSFLLALTGMDVADSGVDSDLAGARDRFREVVAAQERFARSSAPENTDLWLGLGAAGRMLGEPSYTEVLARSATLAEAANNDAALAEAAAMATWPGAFFFIADNPDDEMIQLCEKALARLGSDDPIRIRVLATLASNLAFAEGTGRRRELIAEAHRLATDHGDPALFGAVLNAEFISMWEPATLRRREEIGVQLTDVAIELDDHELLYLARFFVAFCATERGCLDVARKELLQLRDLLPSINNQYFEFLSERLLLSIDIAMGEEGLHERIDALAVRHGSTYADTDGTWALQVGGLAYQAGTLGTMVPAILGLLDGPHARNWQSALALAHVVAGDREAAEEAFAQQDEIPASYFWMSSTQTQAEVAASLGDLDACASLFDQLSPFRGLLGVTASGSLIFGLVSRSLGDLALTLGHYDQAVELLEEAVAQADAIGMPFERTIARRMLAQAHVARGAEIDTAEGFGAALVAAEQHGYGREAQLLTNLREEGFRVS